MQALWSIFYIKSWVLFMLAESSWLKSPPSFPQVQSPLWLWINICIWRYMHTRVSCEPKSCTPVLILSHICHSCLLFPRLKLLQVQSPFCKMWDKSILPASYGWSEDPCLELEGQKHLKTLLVSWVLQHHCAVPWAFLNCAFFCLLSEPQLHPALRHDFTQNAHHAEYNHAALTWYPGDAGPTSSQKNPSSQLLSFGNQSSPLW